MIGHNSLICTNQTKLPLYVVLADMTYRITTIANAVGNFSKESTTSEQKL